MTNKKSIKVSTTKSSMDKREPKSSKWLLDNIAEASKNARKIYFLFIGFLIYCGITIVSTSDRQIILNDAISLPIIKVEVPLNGFFILGPVIAIFVFIYLQLYLSIRKDLINNLKADYPKIGSEHLYPWMLIVLDYPKKGLIGRLQSSVVKFTVWCSVPFVLMLISTWYIKKHEPVLAYIIGLAPIFGTIIIFLFWIKYENVEFRFLKILRFIKYNLGKFVLIFVVIVYEMVFIFYIIPNANTGFSKFYSSHFNFLRKEISNNERLIIPSLRNFFCIDLSYQSLVEKKENQTFWINLQGIHLEGAMLDTTILERANFQEACLQRITMSNASLQEANFNEADLTNANLSESNLQKASLFLAKLQNATLHYADLRAASLKWADLSGASFNEAILDGAGLEGADLQDASLEASLQEAKLTGATLIDACLSHADLQGADLRDADLTGVDFSFADFRKVHNLSLNQLSKVKTLYKTKLDPELEKQIKEKYPHLLEKESMMDKIEILRKMEAAIEIIVNAIIFCP